MSIHSDGRQFISRPQSDNSKVKDTVTTYDQNIRIFRYCGGAGGGACVTPAGTQFVIWPFRVPKFITHISKVIFNNPELTGLQFFTDGGADAFCAHTLAVEQDFYMGLAATALEDPEPTARAGTVLNGLPPYDIEFPVDKCPQPTDTGWENIIYVYVWWGNSAFIDAGSAFHDLTEPSIELVKVDNEMKI